MEPSTADPSPETTTEPETATECTTPAAWVEDHGDYLFHFAVGQVRDRCVAEDLVQETFLAALKGRERFAGQSSERTWLMSILRHKIMDQLRRNYRRPTVALDSAESSRDPEALVWVHEVADDCLSPHHRLELTEFRSLLETALGRLPPRVAQVFQMYEIEDCSGREVCATVNISEQNLWVMLHRARKQLREELASWWDRRPAREEPSRRN